MPKVVLLYKDSPEFQQALEYWYQEWKVSFDASGVKNLEDLKAYYMDKNNITCYGYKDDVGTLIGTYSLMLQGTSLYICDIYVIPSRRKEGIGSKMVKDAIDKAYEGGYQAVYLYSARSNVSWYAKRGFEEIREEAPDKVLMKARTVFYERRFPIHILLIVAGVIGIVTYIVCRFL